MTNLTPKVYETTSDKRKDFIWGLAIWIVANLLMAGAFFGLGALSDQCTSYSTPACPYADALGLALFVCGVLPMILNLIALIVAAVYRKWLALGMLSGFAAALVLVMCAAVIFLAICFTSLSNI